MPLQPGRALLEFDWAGRVGSISSGTFEVKLNGQLLEGFQPTNDDLFQEDVEFNLLSCPVESELEFCGKGPSDSLGALVDNIKLANWDKCATQKIVNY